MLLTKIPMAISAFFPLGPPDHPRRGLRSSTLVALPTFGDTKVSDLSTMLDFQCRVRFLAPNLAMGNSLWLTHQWILDP